MFWFMQEPSSGSYNQSLTKITSLVQLCVSVQTLSVLWQHILTRVCVYVCVCVVCVWFTVQRSTVWFTMQRSTPLHSEPHTHTPGQNMPP